MVVVVCWIGEAGETMGGGGREDLLSRTLIAWTVFGIWKSLG